MAVVSLITTLAQHDIRLWLENDQLKYSAPDGAMTADIIQQLRDAKADIITFLQKTEKNQMLSIPIADRSQALLASYAQQRLWFIHQLNPNSSAYHIHVAFSVKGQLNCLLLSQACTEIIRRHDILRTSYQQIEGKVQQIIHAPYAYTITPTLIKTADLPAALEQERHAPFQLEQSVFRACAWQTAPDAFALAFTIHHIAADGWSLGIFVNELVQLYSSYNTKQPSPLADLPRQYVDYAHWQHQNSALYEQQLHYWQTELNHVPNLSLPYHVTPSVNSSAAGASISFELNSAQASQLQQLNKACGTTLFMSLLAALSIVLHRYSQQDDFCIGTPIAGRSNSQLEPLIGCFINVLAIRCKPSAETKLSDYLLSIKDTCKRAFLNQDAPFEQIVQDLGIERDLAINPIFQVMLSVQNAPFAAIQTLGDLSFHALEETEPTAQMDLNLTAAEHSNGITLRLSYKKALFAPSIIQKLGEHLVNIIDALCQQPQQTINKIHLVTLEEAVPNEQLHLHTLDNRPIHFIVSEQARLHSQAIAVEFANKQLTYAELEQKTDALAAILLTRGIQKGHFIAIYQERSIDLVISILAILKAGAAYIPIDTHYPAARTQAILTDSQAALVLTHSALASQLSNVPILTLDNLSLVPTTYTASECSQYDAAYIIYTSGSTGTPKGVVIPHGALSNHMQWMQQEFNFNQQDRFLQKTPIVFDASVWEFFAPLMIGATLVVAPNDAHKNPTQLNQIIQQAKISVAQFVPSLLHACLHHLHPQQWLTLTTLFCGGEALSPALVNEFYQQQPNSQLINLYGPTETTIDASFSYCRANATTITIGKPISNAAFFVLDKQLNLLPQGIAGELYIAGLGLARGYLHQESLNQTHFINNPFCQAPFNRLYKTGDQVRLLSDNQYEYLGRIDQQLKIRGLRIEVGEIESRLQAIPDINECLVCAIHKDNQIDNQHLVAYYTSNKSLTSQEIRKTLLEHLPHYMIPSYFVPLTEWPLNNNGKIDRKKLPTPNWSELNRPPYTAPTTITQTELCTIWQDVLRLDKVGIHDNFFELGGHSLSATQAISKAQEVFSIELPLRDIFENPTIAAIAELIDITLLQKSVFSQKSEDDDDTESFIL